MKIILLVAFGMVLAGFSSFSADVAVPGGSISFTNIAVLQVLEVYKAMTGLELVTDSRVKMVRHQVALEADSVPKDKVVKLLEKALLDQAGVVITHLDDKRASVTCNDALPIIQATHAPKGN
jgi:hypothetical protein